METQSNYFYKHYTHYFLIGLMVVVVVMMGMVGFIIYQVTNQPLPPYSAVQPNGEILSLTPYDAPNLLPDTIIRWASKAAIAAYTFDFVNYEQQISLARPYFTDAGWKDYQRSVQTLLSTIVKNQLFINGVVSGAPVISNQGPLGSSDSAWRIQIPFLVSYQSANTTYKRNFYVVLLIVPVSTSINPQGIGIDQFVMV